jgi:hypothetical protein
MKRFFSVTPLIPSQLKRKLGMDRGAVRELSVALSRWGLFAKISLGDGVASPRPVGSAPDWSAPRATRTGERERESRSDEIEEEY